MQAAKFTLKRLCISQIKAAERNLFSLLLYSFENLKWTVRWGWENPLHPGVHWVWVPLAVMSLCNYFQAGVGENWTNWSSHLHHYPVSSYSSFLKVRIKLHLERLGRPKALVFRPQNVSIYQTKKKDTNRLKYLT